MANRWWNNGNSDRLYFLGLPNHCGWWPWPWNQKMLAPCKVMTNLDHVLKSRDITLLTKVHILKVMVPPGVIYRCENWTIKKVERWRIDAFKLCCWRRLLRVPWTARRLNQSIHRKSTLNIHWKDCCWSWSSNTLATWCKEHHWKRPWYWERFRAGEEGGDRGWDGWMASLTQWMCCCCCC